MAAISDKPRDVERSIQHFSDEYDRSFKLDMERDTNTMSSRPQDTEEKLNKIDEAIKAVNKYSYQYNVNINILDHKSNKYITS